MELATILWFVLAAVAGYYAARMLHLTGSPAG